MIKKGGARLQAYLESGDGLEKSKVAILDQLARCQRWGGWNVVVSIAGPSRTGDGTQTYRRRRPGRSG